VRHGLLTNALVQRPGFQVRVRVRVGEGRVRVPSSSLTLTLTLTLIPTLTLTQWGLMGGNICKGRKKVAEET